MESGRSITIGYPYQWCINKSWTLYGSVDGKEWTQPAHEAIDCSTFNQPVRFYSGIMENKPNGENFAEPFKGRYVKLVVEDVFVGPGTTDGFDRANTDSKDVRIYELEVLGY